MSAHDGATDSEDGNSTDSEAEYVRWKQAKLSKATPFDIDQWYPALAPITFRTSFIDLSAPEAAAMVAAYRHRYLGRDAPTAEQLGAISAFKARLQQAMRADGADGYMVRLSSRSPKDATAPSREDYQTELQRRLDSGEANDVNAQMRAFFEVTSQALRVRDADAALRMLLSSERVHRDLHDALLTTAGAEAVVRVAIREWAPALDQEWEFRGFVCRGELTALSQYNNYCFYPAQLARRDELQRRLHDFVEEKVRPLVAPLHETYVVDIALLSTGELVVIELNPFDEMTGGGLFRWETERHTLENGPLHLRLATAPPGARLQPTIDHFVSELPTEAELRARVDGLWFA